MSFIDNSGRHLKFLLDIPKNFWNKAPKSIAEVGYGTLILFALTAFLCNAYSKAISGFLITSVIVFGFMIAIWGFTRIASSRIAFHKNLGKILASGTLLGIAYLFITMLLYFGTGYPVWMDHWFLPGYTVEPPRDVKLKAGELIKAVHSRQTRRYALRGVLISVAQAEENAAFSDPRSAITIMWNPNVPKGTDVELSLRPRGSSDKFSPPIYVDGQTGSRVIAGLKSGTVYEVRLVNWFHGRQSRAEIQPVATNADGQTLSGYYGHYVRKYWGHLSPNSDGVEPNDELGRLFLQPFDSTDGKRVEPNWIYEGGVIDGLPSGHGKLETDPLECRSPACGSYCTGEFTQGKLTSGKCSIFVGGIAVPADRGEILYDGISHYTGQATEADHDSSVILGPLSLWFSGQGHLDASDSDYQDTYDGEWQKGRLIRGDTRKSSNDTNGGAGVLSGGQQYVLSSCLLRMTPMAAGGSIAGPAGQLSCDGMEIGDYRGDNLFYGFEFERHKDDSRTTGWWFDGGKRIWLKQNSFPETNDCLNSETFGLPAAINQNKDDKWRITCEKTSNETDCTAESTQIDLAVYLKKTPPYSLDIRFRMSTTGRDGTTDIHVGSKKYTLRSTQRQSLAENVAILATKCAEHNSQITNDDIRFSESLDSFCPALAVSFARTLACD